MRAKNKIFKSAAKKQDKMKALERELRTKSKQLDTMTKAQLRAYVKKTDQLLAYKFGQQQQELGGFQTKTARDFNKDIYGLRTGLDKASKEALRSRATRFTSLMSKTTMSFAKEERHRKLDALRKVGVKRPRTQDLYLFWDLWEDLADEGLPPYLEHLGRQDINGLYSARDAYNEWRTLPASQRTDETLRQLATQNFLNTQAAVYGRDFEQDRVKATEEYKRLHGKAPKVPLTNEQIRMYSRR